MDRVRFQQYEICAQRVRTDEDGYFHGVGLDFESDPDMAAVRLGLIGEALQLLAAGGKQMAAVASEELAKCTHALLELADLPSSLTDDLRLLKVGLSEDSAPVARKDAIAKLQELSARKDYTGISLPLVREDLWQSILPADFETKSSYNTRMTSFLEAMHGIVYRESDKDESYAALTLNVGRECQLLRQHKGEGP